MLLNPRALPLVVILLSAIAGCGSPDPSLTVSQGQGTDPGGEILFVAGGDIYIWDGDLEQVTRGVHAMSPRWSPAGDRFVYVEMHADMGYSDLLVARRDGIFLEQVTNNRPDAEPFSEAFVRYANWAIDPAWSPAGEQLAWVSDFGGWEVPPDLPRLSDPLYLWFSETWEAPPYLLPSSEEIPILSLEGYGVTQESPTFSPDGDQLAFVARAEPPEIWTIDLNGGALAPLVASGEAAYDPTWSPDGDSLAFIQRSGTTNDVWIAPLNGDEPYQLTTIGSAVSPTWSPDGRFIAFFRESRGEFEAWYVEITTESDGQLSASEPEQLFTAEGIDAPSGMSWFGTN